MDFNLETDNPIDYVPELGDTISTDEWEGQIIAWGDYSDLHGIDTFSVLVFLKKAYRMNLAANYVTTFITRGLGTNVRYYKNIVHAVNAYADEYGMDV